MAVVSIDKELVNYAPFACTDWTRLPTVITDDNDTPNQIDNVEDFYSDISQILFPMHLTNIRSEYSKLEKQRSIDGLVE